MKNYKLQVSILKDTSEKFISQIQCQSIARAALFQGLNYTQNEKEFILITNTPFISAARGNSQTMKVCIFGTVFMIMAVETTIITYMQ